MPTQWAVIADESRARIFARVSSNGSWQDIDDVKYKRTVPVSNGREQRLPNLSNQPGDLEPIKRGIPGNFANVLADHLSLARKRGDYDQLILVAPAAMLEDLRSSLDSGTRRKLVDAAEADIVSLPLQSARRELARMF